MRKERICLWRFSDKEYLDSLVLKAMLNDGAKIVFIKAKLISEARDTNRFVL